MQALNALDSVLFEKGIGLQFSFWKIATSYLICCLSQVHIWEASARVLSIVSQPGHAGVLCLELTDSNLCLLVGDASEQCSHG